MSLDNNQVMQSHIETYNGSAIINQYLIIKISMNTVEVAPHEDVDPAFVVAVTPSVVLGAEISEENCYLVYVDPVPCGRRYRLCLLSYQYLRSQ